MKILGQKSHEPTGNYTLVKKEQWEEIQKLAETIKQIPLEQLCQSNVYPLLNLILENK